MAAVAASRLTESPTVDITGRRLVVFLAIVGLVNFATLLPVLADARQYLLFDAGAFLKADGLLRLGLRPSVDFPFNYGLLALAIQRLVIVLLGSSPWSQVALAGVLQIAAASFIGLAASQIGIGRSTALLLAVLMPHLLMYVGLVPSVHGVELTLLVLSLALWLRGFGVAAALAALAAALVKSGIGLLLSMSLLAHMVWTARTPGELRRGVGRYAVGVVVLVSPLVGWLGVRSLGSALLASDARLHYAAMGYGVSQLMHGFLSPAGANVRYYFGHPVALLLALVVLVTGGAVWRLVSRARRAWPRGTFVLLCAGITWVWLLFAFGNGWSWGYYLFAVVLGAVTVLEALPNWARRSGTFAVICLGIVSYRTVMADRAIAWRDWRPAAELRFLWADDALVAEWRQVRRVAELAPTIAVWAGGVPGVFGPIQSAPYWMLAPGLDSPGVLRSLETLANASCFVVRLSDRPDVLFDWIPDALASQLRSFHVAFKGGVFTILRNPECPDTNPSADAGLPSPGSTRTRAAVAGIGRPAASR